MVNYPKIPDPRFLYFRHFCGNDEPVFLPNNLTRREKRQTALRPRVLPNKSNREEGQYHRELANPLK